MRFVRSKTGIVVILLIAIFAFLNIFTDVFGGTFLGVSLRTNPDLDSGLMLHSTFDGPDTDISSTTAEIFDISESGNTGNMINF